ncbi:MAG TPA: prepilin-type N-terminal cleavage/methylation domain-containing protein [Oceanithermus profundus]|uniref:Prepilin-type N-terminal cleavage/methylation domain-containing protein n=1 Tax=Oceanithermus profundus TaxID=187137 RepID=A0A7C4ZAE7_9DEIN|nr:prepilin-type N-terminal cleavage/methylation domain-containing protein [Oceanithermus profundus]
MRHPSGFSLIEVLIALFVVTVVSFAAVTTMVSSIRHNADNRVRSQAVAASEAWMDRFRSRSLPFNYFTTARTFDYGYGYTGDPVFTASGDPNLSEIASEWGRFKFVVDTQLYSSAPIVWRVRVTGYFKKRGGEGHVELVSLVRQ